MRFDRIMYLIKLLIGIATLAARGIEAFKP